MWFQENQVSFFFFDTMARALLGERGILGLTAKPSILA